MYNSIICRYNEIATKGNNRSMFENKLIENMRSQCSDVEDIAFHRLRGRVFIHKKEKISFTDAEILRITEALSRVFGLESFSPALECAPDMDQIKKAVSDSASAVFEKFAREDGKTVFRVRAKRADKSFPLDSKGVEIEVASLINDLIGTERIKLNLTKADITVGVEIREKNALVYYETFQGPGGLPVGSNSPLLVLLSGGIDSPVACNMLMRRGCHVDFLTFHSYPYTPMESLDKVKKIADLVNRYQSKGILYACNISEIQKLIRDNCNPKYRTVLYRRMMMRMASMICEKRKLEGIVTGEAVGQVASQTVANLSVINEAASYVVLRPLCGMDKLETIHRAEKIGTFETSIIPIPDSCTVFAPPSPVLHAKLPDIEYEESKIDGMDDALNKALEEMEIYHCQTTV